MHVNIRITPNDKRGDLRTYIEHRLTIVLSRFTGRVGAIEVGVQDGDGSASGIDKSCQIRGHLLPSGICVILETHDANLYAAIDRAVDGISRLLERQMERDLNAYRPSTEAQGERPESRNSANAA